MLVTECRWPGSILEGDGNQTQQELTMSPRTLAHHIARKRAARLRYA